MVGGDVLTEALAAWGRGGDLVWMVFVIGMIWVVAGMWWR